MTRRIGFGDKKEESSLVRRDREERLQAAAARRAEAAERRAERRHAEKAETAKPTVRGGSSSSLGWVIALLVVIGVAIAVFLAWLPEDPVEAEFLIEDLLYAAEDFLAVLPRLIVPAIFLIVILMIRRGRKNRVETGEAGPATEQRAKQRPLSARARRRAEREHAKELSEGVEQPGGCARVFIGLFLLLWLSGWTAGIVFAFMALLEGGPESWFLGIWITAALFGWVIAAWKLVQVVTGVGVENVKR